MTTWVKVTPDTALWKGAGSILFLLTEDGENMLQEDGELIMLEESKTSSWTKKSNTSPTWTKLN